MNDLLFASVRTMAEMVREKRVSPVELLQAHIERIEAVNPRLNAIVTGNFETALGRAPVAEQAVMRGELWGPLHGVPFTLKDSIETAGLRTVSGTRLREQH